MTIYRLQTAACRDRPLEAWSLGELAELIECALAAGDPLERLYTGPPPGPLSPGELEYVLVLLAR